MKRSTLFASAASVVLAAVAVFGVACSDDDPAKPADVQDAAPIVNVGDADPCSVDNFKGVGTACRLPAGRICFSQCTNGGCFCENGLWACRTDTSCFRDTGLFEDVVEIPVDASNEDANADAANAADAADASSDASSDATDASTDAASD